MFKLSASLIVTVFCVSVASAQEASLFQELLVTDPVGVRYGDAVLGDFDMDGDQDLIMIGYADEDPRPILGRPAGPLAGFYTHDGITQVEVPNSVGETEFVDAVAFTESNAVGQELIGLWYSAIAVGDFDSNGTLDVATLGLDGSDIARLYVYEYSQEQGLLDLVYELEGLYSGDLGWGDFDNDGDVDLVACGRNWEGVPETVLYDNTGESLGRFEVSTNAFTGLAECDLDIGDYDTDGDLDLVVAGVTAEDGFLTLVYDNVGSGQLMPASHAFRSRGWQSVAWGDFDMDGDLDLVQSGARITPMILEGVVTVYRNEAGSFVEEDILEGGFTNDPTPGRFDGNVDWGDQDNSGYPDFVITGFEGPLSSESTQIYNGRRGTRFAKSVPDKFDGGVHGTVLWFDHDYDLDLDLFIMGHAPRDQTMRVRVMQNTIFFGLESPSPPTEMQAKSLDATSVQLSWDGANDTHTPNAGLTYNLRVGTEPGGIDLVSPLADLSTGRRYVSRRGNVDHNKSWILYDLEPGTVYYWSVQAIDQTFSASEFSAEGSFEVSGPEARLAEDPN
ncbi:MAG: hypothetical protein F4221_12410 [Rhodothermaceae bacterium]|nr:hypothetical protein [Rhodothermaceae bacterium]